MNFCKKAEKICENLGWNCSVDGEDVMVSQYSPDGEDFFFYATKKGFSHSVYEYYEAFDIDEHVRDVMNINGAPRLSVLVHDAEEIADMLEDLAIALAG